MPDPSELAALGGSAVVASKVLGPTAEHYGSLLVGGVQAVERNVASVLTRAAKKVGGSLDTGGAVAPRVARSVLEEAAFAEDEIVAEYLSGVLATSRTVDGKDDRGVAYSAQVSRLSSFDLRIHYIIYAVIKAQFDATGLNLSMDRGGRDELVVGIDLIEFLVAAELRDHPDFPTVMAQAFSNLVREDLVGAYSFGSSEHITKAGFPAPFAGVGVRGTGPGIDLFMWATGNGQRRVNDFIDPGLVLDQVDGITLPTSVVAPRKKAPEVDGTH